MQERLDREQRQNHHRPQLDLLIAESRPRRDSEKHVNCKRNGQAIQNKYWCTGKDSNLRTPLGGADLQSAGFNHSPTCAKLPTIRPLHYPAALTDLRMFTEQRPISAMKRIRQIQAHLRQRVLSLHVGKFLMECVPGDPAALLPRLPCAKRPAFRKLFLELAKGFEPPTL